MTRVQLDLSFQHILCYVREKELKSESYIDTFLEAKDPIYDAHIYTAGGYIDGKVELGIILSLLAGGDALDLGVIINIISDRCTTLMYEVQVRARLNFQADHLVFSKVPLVQ